MGWVDTRGEGYLLYNRHAGFEHAMTGALHELYVEHVFI